MCIMPFNLNNKIMHFFMIYAEHEGSDIAGKKYISAAVNTRSQVICTSLCNDATFTTRMNNLIAYICIS